MSADNYGGQRANMEADSMVGTLACQARAIWPKEREVLRRRLVRPLGRVLDLGCGTGEGLRRFREEFSPRLAVGADLYRGHLLRACGPLVQGDAFRLPFPDRCFDLVLVRHLLHAHRDPVAILREVRRVGRRAHLLVEDYAAILFDLEDYAAMDHFREVAEPFRRRGTDLYQGRRAFRQLREAGFLEIEVEPLLVDNQTGDREALAGVFRFWKEGYAATLAELAGRDEGEVRRRFDLMIAAATDPGRYTAWLLFALWAR